MGRLKEQLQRAREEALECIAERERIKAKILKLNADIAPANVRLLEIVKRFGDEIIIPGQWKAVKMGGEPYKTIDTTKIKAVLANELTPKKAARILKLITVEVTPAEWVRTDSLDPKVKEAKAAARRAKKEQS